MVLRDLTKPRKPLRRTAWTMLIGGLAGTAIMLGTGVIMVSNAPPAGPGQEATWPAGEPRTPDFTGNATITCDQPVALLTGTPRVVAAYTRGPLVTVPLLITALGMLFFFPRFTHSWAQLATRGWLRKLLRLPPPH